jgi:magnesium chelatase accessory protein
MTDAPPPDGRGGKPAWQREGRDWPHRTASRFVRSGGICWHVQRMGQGPVVLLLHGAGGATHSWAGLMPLLATRFTVIAPDLPGHGFTDTPAGDGLSLPGMARLVRTLLADLDAEPVLVVGHSAGAAIAIRMALDAPGTSPPIVSINGALLPFPGIAARLFPSMAKLLFVNPFVPHLFAMQARAPGMVERFLAKSTGSRIDATGVELYGRLFRSSGHVAGALGMMASWNLDALKPLLAKVDAPVLLVSADRDSAVPPSVARDVATLIPGAEVVALTGLGHLAHEEQPQRLAEIIIGMAGGEAGWAEKITASSN